MHFVPQNTSGLLFFAYTFLNMVMPKTSNTTHTAIKIKNSTFAIEAAPAATSVKPKTAATIAIIKNANDQRNIVLNLG